MGGMGNRFLEIRGEGSGPKKDRVLREKMPHKLFVSYALYGEAERRQRQIGWCQWREIQEEWSGKAICIFVGTDSDAFDTWDSDVAVTRPLHTHALKAYSNPANCHLLSDLTLCTVCVSMNTSKGKWAGATVNCVLSSFQQMNWLCRLCYISVFYHLLCDHDFLWVFRERKEVEDKGD